MTIRPTDDRISSDVTPHYATRHPDPVPGEPGWAVSWLPGRVVGHNEAISAMMIAELVASIVDDESQGRRADAQDERGLRINGLAHELGLCGGEAIRLVQAPAAVAAESSVGVR